MDRFSEGGPQQGEHGALPYFRRAPTPARRMRDCSDTHGGDPADLLKVKSTKAWGPCDEIPWEVLSPRLARTEPPTICRSWFGFPYVGAGSLGGSSLRLSAPLSCDAPYLPVGLFYLGGGTLRPMTSLL